MKKRKCIWVVIAVLAATVLIFNGCRMFLENAAEEAEYIIRGTEGTAISFDEKTSFFSDFEVVGNDVYFHCDISIKNDGPQDIKFKLAAVSDEDQKSGLLETAEIDAVDLKTGTEQVFEIPAGQEKTYKVAFRTAKGTMEPPRKVDRMLPGTIIMTVL